MTNSVEFEAVIGLEVHCQLSTRSKLFCSCPTSYGSAPNSNTCEVCLGLPGALPVLNKEAVVKAVQLAISLNGHIQKVSVFDRKQYFYQDLPKGYQISQFNIPYSVGGGLNIDNGKFIRLRRIHLEEDAGKSFHRNKNTAIDLNRAGIPLVEIVTEPDFSLASEAVDFFKKLQMIGVHLGISDGIMEEGSLRCDANISVRKMGEKSLGVRCEIKNLNSFRFLERAIDYEISRQIDLIRSGKSVVQETRLYDDILGKTSAMRAKENSHDYRYFPEPDLRPLVIDDTWLNIIKANILDMPEEKKKKFLSLQVSHSDADTILADVNLCRFFEILLDNSGIYPDVTPKLVSHWMTREILSEKCHVPDEAGEYKLEAHNILELLALVAQGVITARVAQSVFQKMLKTGAKPLTIVEKEGLKQVSNEAEIVMVVEKVIHQNPKQLAEFLSGKEKVLAFFVGQVMRVSQGTYSPNTVNEIVRKQLDLKKI